MQLLMVSVADSFCLEAFPPACTTTHCTASLSLLKKPSAPAAAAAAAAVAAAAAAGDENQPVQLLQHPAASSESNDEVRRGLHCLLQFSSLAARHPKP
jgi:hypothetical protein